MVLKNDDISSENERRQRNSRKDRESNSRKDKIEIHHTETCRVYRSTLPEDAVSKGLFKFSLMQNQLPNTSH